MSLLDSSDAAIGPYEVAWTLAHHTAAVAALRASPDGFFIGSACMLAKRARDYILAETILREC